VRPKQKAALNAKEQIILAFRRRDMVRVEEGWRDIVALDAMDPMVANVAMETFDSAKGALHWLTSPEVSLRGRRPLEVARTPRGITKVVKLMKRIDRGTAC
jgi:uncharacterized protein (DUF2384 family)